jgi:hypothetical protein
MNHKLNMMASWAVTTLSHDNRRRAFTDGSPQVRSPRARGD